MAETQTKVECEYFLPPIPERKRGCCWLVKKILIVIVISLVLGTVIYSSRNNLNCAQLLAKRSNQNQLQPEPVANFTKTTCPNSTTIITKAVEKDECQLEKEAPEMSKKFQFITSNNYSVILRLAGYIQYHSDPYELNRTNLVHRFMPLEAEAVELTYTSESARRLDLQLKCGNISVRFNKNSYNSHNSYYYNNEQDNIVLELEMSNPLHSEKCEIKIPRTYIVGENDYRRLSSNKQWCKQKVDLVPELGEVTCSDVISYKCSKASKHRTGKFYDFATAIFYALEFEIEPRYSRAVIGRFTSDSHQ